MGKIIRSQKHVYNMKTSGFLTNQEAIPIMGPVDIRLYLYF